MTSHPSQTIHTDSNKTLLASSHAGSASIEKTPQHSQGSALTENEIRPQELMVEQARLFAQDVADLMSNAANFKEAPCPACNAHSHQPAFEKTGLSFVHCNVCDTVFASPRPQPEHLEQYYRNSRNYAYWNKFVFPASEDARREKIFRPRVERVLNICKRFGISTRTLLEVGGGFGTFCEELMKCKVFQNVVAVEPTPDLAQHCRSRGITVIEKLIEQVTTGDIESGLNVIVSFEVIEHLFDPRQFVKKCHQLLEQQGLLILSCPNVKGFDMQALGAKSTAVDVEHINLFHPASLTRLLDACGFEVLDIQTPGQLDAELVRNALLAGELDPNEHPFYSQILLDNWERTGQAFQEFLIQNGLSSHMVAIARKK